jgi:hypothetical protein
VTPALGVRLNPRGTFNAALHQKADPYGGRMAVHQGSINRREIGKRHPMVLSPPGSARHSAWSRVVRVWGPALPGVELLYWE